MDTVLTHLPIGSHEWECVASEHNENFPDKDRTGTSIWRKFAQLQKVKIPSGDRTCPAEVRHAKQVFRKIEERADASGEADSTYLGIEDGNNVNDEFMVLEDSQDNAEVVETSDRTPACSVPEATPAVSAGATVARSASERVLHCMVPPQLRDKPMSNSLNKMLALVSTQLLQKRTRMKIFQCRRCKCSNNSNSKLNSNRT